MSRGSSGFAKNRLKLGAVDEFSRLHYFHIQYRVVYFAIVIFTKSEKPEIFFGC
jgi:hypothetical protein